MSVTPADLNDEFAALRSLFEAEVRRLDQVGDLRDKSVAVALVAAEKAVNAALAAADKATDKSEKATRDAFEKVNEFRGALDDLSKTMATRRELEDYKKAVDAALDTLRNSTINLGSRLDSQPEVRALTTRADLSQGRRSGIGDTLSFGHMLFLVAVAVAGLYLATH